jgi:GNAT superfamily N-acetyltransferase
VTGVAGTWSGRVDDLIERVERSRRRNLLAYATAYRTVYPDARTTTRQLAGGVAAFIETGSPVNQLSAAGLTEPISDRGLAVVESFFAEFGGEFEAWVAPERDVAPFAARGYPQPTTIRVFARPAVPVDAIADRITVERVERGSTDEAETYGRLAALAFGSPAPVMIRLFAAFFAVPGIGLYRAAVDGAIAGVARLVIDGDLAEFGGGATLPEFRGRGVQQAMLHHRIDEACAAGCSMLVTEAEPETGSARNILRAGFEAAFDYSVFTSRGGDPGRDPTAER